MHRPRRLPRYLLLLALLGTAGMAKAGHEGIIEIWQPFEHVAAGGMGVHPVPYASLAAIINGDLGLVVAEGSTGVASGGPLRFENRNLASLCGLTFRRLHSGQPPDGFFGDTLKVVLDATGFHTVERFGSVTEERLLCRTAACVRGSARSAGGSPGNAQNYLDLRVDRVGAPPVHVVWDLREPYDPRTDHPAELCPRDR